MSVLAGVSALGIDTAGPVVGAALLTPWGVRSWSARVDRGADARLLPELQQLLRDVPASAPISVVAVSVGPGAFTGLRVGVAAALGLAISLNVPVAPVSSLAARAALASGPRVVAVLDARKGRVYRALFDARGRWPTVVGAEEDIDPGLPWPARRFAAVGEGALVHRVLVEAAGGVLVPFADRCPAEQVARAGLAGLVEAMDPALVALQYLRAPDAQPRAVSSPTKLA
jgi:tRNA threonylcarbamoyl adenosine modification protein YeaZ